MNEGQQQRIAVQEKRNERRGGKKRELSYIPGPFASYSRSDGGRGFQQAWSLGLWPDLILNSPALMQSAPFAAEDNSSLQASRLGVLAHLDEALDPGIHARPLPLRLRLASNVCSCLPCSSDEKVIEQYGGQWCCGRRCCDPVLHPSG